MAEAAKRRGLKYMAITDHSKRVAMANGLDARRVLEQWAEIDALKAKRELPGIGEPEKVAIDLEIQVKETGLEADLNKEKAEVLLFVGCTASFDPRVQEVARAMVRVPEMACGTRRCPRPEAATICTAAPAPATPSPAPSPEITRWACSHHLRRFR